MATRTEGLDSFKAKFTRRLPAEARQKVKAANLKNAEEFRALLVRIMPSSEDAPHLRDSVELKEVGEFGVQVSEGNAQVPYPAHLELGHRARDGTQVEAMPHWFPAKRVLKKKHRGRQSRAMNAALKAVEGT